MNPLNIQKAKELMEQGWKAREDFKFEEAEKLLTDARQIFITEEDWFNVTESMNHLAYSFKLQAQQMIDSGLEIAKSANELAKAKGTKDIHALRAIISLLDSAGKFEEEIKHLVEYIQRQEKPAAKGDMQSHLATCYLRTGKTTQALNTIDESLKNIDAGWEIERDPHRSIWKSKALAVKALIFFDMDDKISAKEFAEKSVQIAKSVDAKTRIKQAEDLIKFLQETSV